MGNKATEDKNLNEFSEEEMNQADQQEGATVDLYDDVDNSADQEQASEQSAVARLEEEVSSLKDKYVRLYSDFENYKRRVVKEKYETISTANKELMAELLPVLDDLERAANVIADSGAASEGVQLVLNKFLKVLEQKGLKIMEIAPGDDFDSEYHEAVAQIPAPQEKLKGKIVDVIEKGYFLGEKVVRFAKVVTGA